MRCQRITQQPFNFSKQKCGKGGLEQDRFEKNRFGGNVLRKSSSESGIELKIVFAMCFLRTKVATPPDGIRDHFGGLVFGWHENGGMRIGRYRCRLNGLSLKPALFIF